jgi:hypothetical protein
MTFPPKFTGDPAAYWSMLAARDGNYHKLSQRICNGTATQEELDLNAQMLAELQAKGTVTKLKAKAMEAVWRDTVAVMVLATEEWLRRRGHKNVRRSAIDHIKTTRLGNSRGSKAIGNAVRAFERDPEKRAFADSFIDDLWASLKSST